MLSKDGKQPVIRLCLELGTEKVVGIVDCAIYSCCN